MPSGKGSKCRQTGKRRVSKIPSFELCTTVSFESHLPGMGEHGGRESGAVIGMEGGGGSGLSCQVGKALRVT